MREKSTVTTVGKGCRVVLVEDDSTVAEGILVLLEMEGFVTALAINGSDALSIIPRFDPDVVVLDVGLPDMGGLELFALIEAQWPDLPVVFSSGQSDLPAIATIVASGRALALGKPYTIEELLAAIATIVERRRSVV